jgi:HK97 family phage major capsid protein
MMSRTDTHREALERITEIRDRCLQLKGKHRLSRDDQCEIVELGAELQELSAHARNLEQAAAIANAARDGSGGFRIERGSGGTDHDDARARGGRNSTALRQLEKSVRRGFPARSAEAVEHVLRTGPDHDRSWAERWVVDTGSEHYRSAFAKIVLFGEARAGLELTAEERAAYDRASRLKQELRALSLTDSAGGFLVPYELDPAVMIQNAGSENPLMQISRIVVSVGDIWHGVTSSGVEFSWDAEASEVSDDSPPFAEPAIPAYKVAGFVPFSIELQGDAPTLLDELGRLLADGLQQKMNETLTTGSGVGQPTGIVTALQGGASVVASAAPDTIASADVYALQNALQPRYQPRARWCANLAVLNRLRQLESANGSLLFPELRSDTPTLAGKPVHELSNMDGTLSGGAGNDPALLYGDFTNYVVTQRVGSSIELVPHLFGPANQRPTGQRGLYSYARYGADSVNDAAFRLLVA